jgi:probable HAF family extracellular repeat protein
MLRRIVIWTGLGLTPLLAGTYSIVDPGAGGENGINNSGQVVGSGKVQATGPPHAFLNSGGTMQDLGTIYGGKYSYA